MDHASVGELWNDTAVAWTLLVRAGYDQYRDHLNTPAFLAMLPGIEGLDGVDIGCGEGHNTRLLAGRGARMLGVDIAERFVAAARQSEAAEPLGIGYRVASAVDLPLAPASFDFAVAFMNLMDIPDTEEVLAEAYRILKPGGFLQFSIAHPCFDTPHRRNLRGDDGLTYAIEVGSYFRRMRGEIVEWTFGSAPAAVRARVGKFRVPRFTRTLSEWLNLLVEAGFTLEQIGEPRPDDATVRRHPALQDSQVVAYFLHVRARKVGWGVHTGADGAQATSRPW